MTRELAIIIGLVFLVVCVTSSDYAGLSFKLTRSADDKFKNPTATGCDWQPENQKFCIDTNSQCLGNCCQCACNYDKSTFDRSTMKCRNNDALRSDDGLPTYGIILIVIGSVAILLCSVVVIFKVLNHCQNPVENYV
ncbi:Hypothetical predicted protein [Paramuricea clavata]|uniref:Uncharacterized protein n=1 Tax=Paramuricea clavata TaxID=317549 RepID=A0A6S7GXI7_PARCT|nr:Hypothetical predicted protein [Paramuricea clavata]